MSSGVVEELLMACLILAGRPGWSICVHAEDTRGHHGRLHWRSGRQAALTCYETRLYRHGGQVRCVREW